MSYILQKYFQRSVSESSIIIISQLVLVATVLILYFWHPVTYVRLVTEDNWGEFATFVAFILASLMFMRLFLYSSPRTRHFWYLLLSVATLVVAMEEISWGQRILGVSTPGLLYNMNFQGEFTFHNIAALAPGNFTYLLISLFLIVYGFVLPILTITSSTVNSIINRVNLPLPSLLLSPLFLASSYFLSFSMLAKGEEIGELLFAISFGCLALECTVINTQSAHPPKGNKSSYKLYFPAFIVISGFLGVALTFSLEGKNVGPKKQLGPYAKRLNAFASNLLPSKQHYQQAMAIFSHLEDNPELTDEYLLYNKGRLLSEMSREEEASILLVMALEKELKLHAKNPEDPGILKRLSLIHSELGNNELKTYYLRLTLDAYEKTMKKRVSQAPYKPRQTYSDLNGKAYPNKDLIRLYITRGNVYRELSEYNHAIEEYLKGSEFTLNAVFSNRIKVGIHQAIFLLCGSTYELDSWQDVDLDMMKKQVKEESVNWCGLMEAKK